MEGVFDLGVPGGIERVGVRRARRRSRDDAASERAQDAAAPRTSGAAAEREIPWG